MSGRHTQAGAAARDVSDAPASQSSEPRPEPSPSVRRMLQTAATVLGPATLVTALAFYFGWVSTNATFSYFGLDASVLGLTIQDIILSSTDALFLPLGTIAVVALVGLAGHALLISWADGPDPERRWVRRISILLAIVGAVAFLLGAWAVLEGLPFPTPFLFQQLGSGIGVAFMAYAVYIRRRSGTAQASGTTLNSEVRRLWAAALALVWVIIGLSVFWAVSEYAKALGRGRARQLEMGLGRGTSVVVYAGRNLHLAGPGVVTERLNGPDSAYPFVYSGLTFLVRSGGKYFLVPSTWSRDGGAVIVLPDEDSIRVEFLAEGR